MLLDILNYESDELINSKEFINHSHDKRSTTNSIFSSQLGMSTISKSVTQISNSRFSVCRNLLILQQLALQNSEYHDSKSLHLIKSSLNPRTVVLTQAHYMMKWICELSISSNEFQKIR